jgi:hypothetical protein
VAVTGRMREPLRALCMVTVHHRDQGGLVRHVRAWMLFREQGLGTWRFRPKL